MCPSGTLLPSQDQDAMSVVMMVAAGFMACSWSRHRGTSPFERCTEGCSGMIELFHAVVLGIVEGLTEFIPVSSTGHLIIAGHLLGFEGPKAATFEVFIQFGAILAVVLLYKERFIRLCSFEKSTGFIGLKGLLLLGLTTLPALALGAIAHGFIKAYLFTPATVAVGLGIGGVGILITERCLPRVRKAGIDSLNWEDALAVGLCQCLALWPGASRSASTILGGMSVGI